MRSEVARDLSRTQEAFVSIVWPAIKPRIGGGELVPVESVTDIGFAKRSLDMLAGIDAWQLIDNTGMRGIASRVQFGDRNWESFTVRYKRLNGAETEYSKRLRALTSPMGLLFPTLTCQAYINSRGELLGAGVAYTKDIICTIATGACGEKPWTGDWFMQTTASDGNEFAVVPWKTLEGNPDRKFLRI